MTPCPHRRVATLLTLIALATSVLAPACAARGREDKVVPGTARVVRVVDGDTVRVVIAGGSGEEAVRLIGIDTPETHGAGGLRECFGKEAARRMAELLPKGTAVRLVRDVEARDRYERLLAYVYRSKDGLFVNLALAREGYAAPLTIPPNVAHSEAFVRAAAQARRESRGLWGSCGGPDTPLESPR